MPDPSKSISLGLQLAPEPTSWQGSTTVERETVQLRRRAFCHPALIAPKQLVVLVAFVAIPS